MGSQLVFDGMMSTLACGWYSEICKGQREDPPTIHCLPRGRQPSRVSSMPGRLLRPETGPTRFTWLRTQENLHRMPSHPLDNFEPALWLIRWENSVTDEGFESPSFVRKVKTETVKAVKNKGVRPHVRFPFSPSLLPSISFSLPLSSPSFPFPSPLPSSLFPFLSILNLPPDFLLPLFFLLFLFPPPFLS